MLNLAEEISDWSFDCFGNPQQCLYGNDFFAAFDFTNIFGIQFHRFGQFLLRQISLFAAQTYGFPDDFPMPQNGFSLFLCHSKRLPRPIADIHQQHAGILDFA